MTQEPNKLESFFWDLIGKEKIEYSSFAYWKTLHRKDGSHFNITPDFKIPKSKAVIEIYGNYWHKDEDPNVRIEQWNQVDICCAVVWESAIRKAPMKVKLEIENFISRNLQERGASHNLIVR